MRLISIVEKSPRTVILWKFVKFSLLHAAQFPEFILRYIFNLLLQGNYYRSNLTNPSKQIRIDFDPFVSITDIVINF